MERIVIFEGRSALQKSPSGVDDELCHQVTSQECSNQELTSKERRMLKSTLVLFILNHFNLQYDMVCIR